ncbi:MAG: glycosyl transferase family 28 [Ignavibacteriales bacterium]|nr:glycosyl transferase family 28 [Ignavibacteriales bacterium]
MNRKKRVLVAPLDWGLGHTTRSVAIINELLRQNAEVIIGADNRPYDLLRKEFPQLEHIRFPGYSVQYSATQSLTRAIIVQLPSILNGFKKEHAVLETLIDKYNIDAVISDNRFGAYSNKVPSIFVIHQLNIMVPSWLQWSRGIVRFVNRMKCNNYGEVWIPDFPGDINIAGELARPKKLPNNTYYIGPLTRLQRIEVEKTIDVLVILSGPEPQRTIFEEMILNQLQETSLVAVFARGKPEQNTMMKVSPNITMINAVSGDEMSRLVASSRMIVSRPGHSTVMDLSFVGAKAIFIPTPQQTEQEYLAVELMKNKICYCEDQANFNLARALERSTEYSGFSAMKYDPSVLQERIHHLLNLRVRQS